MIGIIIKCALAMRRSVGAFRVGHRFGHTSAGEKDSPQQQVQYKNGKEHCWRTGRQTAQHSLLRALLERAVAVALCFGSWQQVGPRYRMNVCYTPPRERRTAQENAYTHTKHTHYFNKHAVRGRAHHVGSICWRTLGVGAHTPHIHFTMEIV